MVTSQSSVIAKFNGRIEFENIRIVTYEEEDGQTQIVVSRSGVINIIDPDSNRVLTKYDATYGAILKVKEFEEVKKGQMIYEWDPYNASIVTEAEGRVRFKDLIANITYREINDEQTGHITKVVIDSRDRTKQPTIEIVDGEGNVLKSYSIPTKAQLRIDDDEMVSVGTPLVKIPRDLGRMRDITGGLPRVTELFEARAPQTPAIVSEIDGIVSYEKQKRGQRVLMVTSLDEKTKMEYMVPIGKYILVQETDFCESRRPSDRGIY